MYVLQTVSCSTGMIVLLLRNQSVFCPQTPFSVCTAVMLSVMTSYAYSGRRRHISFMSGLSSSFRFLGNCRSTALARLFPTCLSLFVDQRTSFAASARSVDTCIWISTRPGETRSAIVEFPSSNYRQTGYTKLLPRPIHPRIKLQGRIRPWKIRTEAVIIIEGVEVLKHSADHRQGFIAELDRCGITVLSGVLA